MGERSLDFPRGSGGEPPGLVRLDDELVRIVALDEAQLSVFRPRITAHPLCRPLRAGGDPLYVRDLSVVVLDPMSSAADLVAEGYGLPIPR